MSWQVEYVFEHAEQLLDREDKRLQNLSILIQRSDDKLDRDGSFAMSRALNYVVCGGILEKMFRDLPDALSRDLLSLGVRRSRLPVQMLAAVDSAEFDACHAGGVQALAARARILSTSAVHVSDHRPLSDVAKGFRLADGTTISTKHFEALWLVLNISGAWSNTQKDVLMLSELADKRNDIAHWNEDPVSVGKGRTTKDFRDLTAQLLGLVENVHLHLCGWLDAL